MQKNLNNLNAVITKAKQGNQLAYSQLLDCFWNDIYKFQLVRTKKEVDAEDITIQTFSKAFDKLTTYDANYDFKNWLLAISKNLHIDLVRKQKNVPKGNDTTSQEDAGQILDQSPSAEDQLITEQNLATLLLYIKKLKPHYQEVINLRYFQELSYHQIATQLNEPINNVKVKLLRAKRLLAQIIENKPN